MADEPALDPNVDWDFVRKMLDRFPGYTWAAADPELRALLVEATQQEWSPDVFEGRLRATEWWRTHSQAQREFAALEGTDPAQATNRVNDLKQQVHTLAQQLGGDIGDEDAGGIAWAALRGGWSEQQIRAQIAAKVAPAGMAGTAISIRQLAHSYMVDLPEATVTDWQRRLFTGELTEDGVRSLLAQQAVSRFPQLAEYIKQGVAPGDFFAPYRKMIADMTGVTDDAVDFLRDPTWMRVISTTDGGGIRPMTLDETYRYIRTTDQFANSRQGKAEAASFEQNLARITGVRA